MASPISFDGWCSIDSTGRIWAAWWHVPPSASPWRTADAVGVGAIENAERAVRAVKPKGLIRQVDSSFADAAAREYAGKPARYRAPKKVRSRPVEKGDDRRAKERAEADAARASAERQAREAWDAMWNRNEPGPVALRALGIAEARPTANDVRRAYRKTVASRCLHPDQGGSPEEFKRVTAICDVALAYIERRSNAL